MREMIVDGQQLIRETTRLSRLTLKEGASLTAPEGKFVQLTVDGVGRRQIPGTYQGDVVLTVAECYHMPPHGLMLMMGRSEEFRDAAVITDNQVIEEQGVSALVQRGTITGTEARDVVLSSDEEDFNGILITGDSDYTVTGAHMDLEGHGYNDFMGCGAAVTAIDNAHVTLRDSQITMSGVTRCAVHVGGDSVVRVENCRIENLSPDDPEWMGDFSWGIGVTGTNRLVQLCDNGTAYYTGCDLKTNGWGVFSIDGCDDSANLYVKDCRVELSGPRAQGYGAFCIGDRNIVRFDHSRVHVDGYPLMVRGMIGAARAEIVNGCEITGNRFGVFVLGDKNTPVTIADSSLVTGKSTLCVKGSATDFHIRNSVLKPGNGVVLQLMDNDEAGMDVDAVMVPVGRVDQYVPGRSLTDFDPALDVSVELADMTVVGDFFNSTTNLHMERECIKGGMNTQPTFGGMFAPPAGADSILDGPPQGQDHPNPHVDHDADLRGPKNLLVELKDARVEGVISSASQTYREGVTQIDQYNRQELSNVTQAAAPTVNNGVLVRLDRFSTWVVTGTSYLTSLDLAPNAILKGSDGRKLVMTVDGVETPVAPGHYQGTIVLTLAD